MYKPATKPVSLVQSNERNERFIAAAGDYRKTGLECFDQCFDSGNDFGNTTMIRGMEKRCMAGCVQIKMNLFTIYGTRFGGE